MTFVYGPLALAVKHGHLLIINEMDLLSLLNWLGSMTFWKVPRWSSHKMAVRSSCHITSFVLSQPATVGSGDQTGLYQGVLQQNLAFLDRFRIIEATYAEPSVEEAILENVAPGLPEVFRQKMVKVAGDIRRLFIGGADGGA